MILVAFSVLLVGVSLFAGLIPVVAGNYADQRFFLCLVCWLVVCFCLGKNLTNRPLADGRSWFWWFLPLITVFLSGELYTATYRVEPLMFAFFFLGVCLLSRPLSQSENLQLLLGRVLSVIAFLSLIYGFIALMNYGFSLRDGNRDIDTVLTWGFPNIRYWSHLATWLLPLAAAAQRSGSLAALPLVKGLFVLSGSFWWWILFSTSARGSALGLLIGSLVVVALFKRDALGWLRSLGVQFLGGGALWLILTLFLPWSFFGAAELREIDADSAGRILLWREAWEMSLVNFPFGMGPQSWLTHVVLSEGYASSKPYGHPHNMYLLWAAEYGWISVVALAFAAAAIIRSVLSCRRRLRAGGCDHTILAGFTASVVAASVHSGFSAVLIAPASMLTGFLVLTLFMSTLRPPYLAVSLSCSISPRRLMRLSSGLALLTVLVVGPFWMHEIGRYYQDNMEDRLTYKGQGSIYSPRFWSHGDFPRQLVED